MPVEVKICGLNTPASVTAAVESGARFAGFVFYPASPRCVTPAEAARLMARVPPGITKVALVVDADDDTLDGIVRMARPDMLQLHGQEAPARVAEVARRFRVPVMKSVAVADAADVATALRYRDAASRLLFDAKPPADATRPGGNARAFDWALIRDVDWPLPWILAGGLTARNVAEAVRTSGARAVDVSSGVEDRPGVKSPDRIRAFLAAARALA